MIFIHRGVASGLFGNSIEFFFAWKEDNSPITKKRHECVRKMTLSFECYF